MSELYSIQSSDLIVYPIHCLVKAKNVVEHLLSISDNGSDVPTHTKMQLFMATRQFAVTKKLCTAKLCLLMVHVGFNDHTLHCSVSYDFIPQYACLLSL